MILLADSDSLSDLLEVRLSTSSIKIILGLCSLASSNRFFTSFSLQNTRYGGATIILQSWTHLSPNHLDTRSELDTEKKVELLASVATAFAKKDLPVPALLVGIQE